MEIAQEVEMAVLVSVCTPLAHFPKMAMLPLAQKPLFVRTVERVRRASLVNNVMVTISTEPEDDVIARACWSEKIPYFRGDAVDLFDRYYRAGSQSGANVMAIIPAHCALIDPAVIDAVIGGFLANAARYDYVSNLHSASYPVGNDVEVVTMDALEIAWRYAWHDYGRQQLGPYFLQNPERFRVHNVLWNAADDMSSLDWIGDHKVDYQFITSVYKALYLKNPAFTLHDILALVEVRPEIAAVNASDAGAGHSDNHSNIDTQRMGVGSRRRGPIGRGTGGLTRLEQSQES